MNIYCIVVLLTICSYIGYRGYKNERKLGKCLYKNNKKKFSYVPALLGHSLMTAFFITFPFRFLRIFYNSIISFAILISIGLLFRVYKTPRIYEKGLVIGMYLLQWHNIKGYFWNDCLNEKYSELNMYYNCYRYFKGKVKVLVVMEDKQDVDAKLVKYIKGDAHVNYI